MELRQYLDVLRRHRWLIIQATLVVAIVAGLLSSLRIPMYQAEARVLLRPNDPAERLDPTAVRALQSADLDRHAEGQMDIVRSEAVARAAAKEVGSATAREVRDSLSVRQHGQSDVLVISATDPDPVRARDLANAVADAYIDNRRENAVLSLREAIKQIEGELQLIQTQIAQYDAAIGDGGLAPGATALPEQSTQPPTDPAQQIDEPTASGLDLGGAPTNDESLKAARYAAAVQYQSLYSRQNDLQVDMTLKRGEAELIEAAETPESPSSPKPVRDGVVGAFVGLLLGLGVSFLRDQIDDRARTKEDIEHATGLPVIAGLPIDDASLRNPAHRATQDSPHSALAEAVRSLRTSVQFLALGEDKIRRIVVTSSAPSEGKTLVAANLATAYAQAGFITVLMSADLRRPRVESMFGIARGAVGLSDLVAQLAGDERPESLNGSKASRRLKGRSTVEVAPSTQEQRETAITAHLVSTSTPNLFVLPAGSPPPNPAELLGSRRAGEVLDELAGSADIVIIDTPPVLAVTDAAVLAARADGVILVTALGQTHRGAARQSKETLEGTSARVLGVVINKTDAQSGSYYGYYGYYGDTQERSARRTLFARQRERKHLRGTQRAITTGDRR